MRVIGLTGGIASGKSTVANELRARGAVVIDADVLAREVIAPGTPGFGEVVARFGSEIVGADGGIDRARLATVVFGDEQARRDLEAITHPRIREAMATEIAAAMASDAPLAVADIPLLYEAGRDRDFPDVLVVYVDPAVQRDRLRERDGFDDDAVEARLAAQMPIAEKLARATWVIDNGGSPAATRGQVAAWWAANVEPRTLA